MYSMIKGKISLLDEERVTSDPTFVLPRGNRHRTRGSHHDFSHDLRSHLVLCESRTCKRYVCSIACPVRGWSRHSTAERTRPETSPRRGLHHWRTVSRAPFQNPRAHETAAHRPAPELSSPWQARAPPGHVPGSAGTQVVAGSRLLALANDLGAGQIESAARRPTLALPLVVALVVARPSSGQVRPRVAGLGGGIEDYGEARRVQRE